MDNPPTQKCRSCGMELHPGEMHGLCPACVGRVVFGEDDGAPTLPDIQSDSSMGAGVPFEKPGDRIGRYKLIQKIGEGGMGIVWMAEQTEPVRRTVALKVIKPGMDSKEVLARFESERQALALMDHPNIAKVLDAGAAPSGRPYFVMDLVKGISLIRFCDEQRLSVRERLQLFIPVCHAIQHAHQKGIIHRDLKPSNVIVALYDGKPVPKVIDFGVAKATGQRLTERTLVTHFGSVVGTLEYMSPEQAELNQLDIDTRSDIYSLGVLLYELLTGTTPLTRESLGQAAFEEVLRRIREEDPPSPSLRLSTSRERLTAISAQRKLNPQKLTKTIRGELDWVVMKALEKDRSRRYETANAFALDLQHYLNDEAVMAGPPTMRYRLKKFLRKHRKAMAVAAAFITLLALATMTSIGLALWANRERTRSEETLAHMQIQKAQEFFAADDRSSGVAYLADVLRRQPKNRVAAEQLLFTLTYRNFPLRLSKPICPNHIELIKFSPDSRRLALITSHDENTNQFVGGSLQEWIAKRRQEIPNETKLLMISLWDASTGEALTDNKVLFQCQNKRISWFVANVQFSPDGELLLIPSTNSVQLRDGRTGKPIKDLRHGTNSYWISGLFSPDGTRLRTITTTSVRLWDGHTGQPVSGELEHEKGSAIRSAIFSPDSERLFTVTSNSIRFWDARTGQSLTAALKTPPIDYKIIAVSAASASLATVPLRYPYRSQPQTPTNYQFSADGKLVAALVGNASVYVWDGYTGQLLAGPLKHETNLRIVSVLLSSDGHKVLATFLDKTAQLWDVKTGKPLPLHRASESVHAENLRIDDRKISSSDNQRPPLGEGLSRLSEKALPPVISSNVYFEHAQFSPQGDRLLAICGDKTLRLWDANIGAELGTPFQLVGNDNRDPVIEFSPDGQSILTISNDVVLVLSTAPALKIVNTIQYYQLCTASFSPNGQYILTTSDSSFRVWETRTGKPVTEQFNLGGALEGLNFSPDEKHVFGLSYTPVAALSALPRHAVRVWEIGPRHASSEPHDDGFDEKRDYDHWLSPNRHYPLLNKIGTQLVSQKLFSLDRKRMLRLWQDLDNPNTTNYWHWCRRWRVFDAFTGLPLTQTHQLETNISNIESIRLSPNGEQVFLLSKEARSWSYSIRDVNTGRSSADPIAIPFVKAFWNPSVISPDGSCILTCTLQEINIWNAVTKTEPKLVTKINVGHTLNFMDYSPDGKRVVITFGGSGDFAARIWDARTGQPLTPPMIHELGVDFACFSPDGCLLATVSNDKAQIWNTHTGQAVTPPLTHEAWIKSVEFSPDSKRILTVTEHGQVRAWDTSTGLLITDPVLPGELHYSATFGLTSQQLVTSNQVWNLPAPPLPVPAWLPEMAEAIVGKRVNATRTLEFVPDAGLWELKKKFSESPAKDFYTRWAKWFFSDSPHRTISPFSTLTMLDATSTVESINRRKAQRVQRLIEENTLGTLTEALRLSPTNGLALARLAKIHFSQTHEKNRPGAIAQADSYSRDAVKYSPNDPEVIKIYADFQQQVQQNTKHIEQLIAENTLDSLHKAVSLSSTNGLALARLAKLYFSQFREKKRTSIAQADTYSRDAVKYSPNDPEVVKIREEIQAEITKLRKP